MAAKPGEENVAVLFGDIHYYYGSPAQNPPHHRFDKGSYVYLFENANERRARIEIANCVGTDDQDAFEGYLDRAHLGYSYKHQCLVSLTAPEASDPSEWHLPTYDPRNENKYHYKLHSVDIYFYTQADALQFVNGIRRVLPPAQVELRDEPGPPPVRAPDAASAVVQQLERVALSEPQAQAAPAPANFTPMAYNPAAPPAPESIRPREKTPPPDDGGVNPLAAAMAYDQQPFSPGLPPPPPPPGQPGQPGQPPGFGGLQRSATMPVAAGLASPSPYGGAQQAPQGYAPQGYAPQTHSTSPAGGHGVPPPPAQGAPSQYYGHQQQGAANPARQDYSVHQQFYRPGEGEQAPAQQQQQQQQQGAGKPRLEDHAARLERGVGGMFKKFEKRFG
ncbi:related to hydroxyproline-rich glycoprotein precursor [Cephalotrichum gorgonifer]|uniref:Related to hydroxyproline-rich glycoprotein n=1 Tax=Cephalotrichum gorgonifer TaxID=2041049 RepID=A0AAE8N769_9PEZI|nr:related to hydroxyproline-rich glycoprotein precursor [Cephalotrichum gorgonifer]